MDFPNSSASHSLPHYLSFMSFKLHMTMMINAMATATASQAFAGKLMGTRRSPYFSAEPTQTIDMIAISPWGCRSQPKMATERDEEKPERETESRRNRGERR
ncbi:hypothetical protein CRG98_014175 [Punica granatum]|uniref:Uncharacterized protein n=1 Tax=Punica granatum TaxID=22663 RepID=A0A2I0KCE7_PUNGR|nr:hypothetical protein CRG98_014175 [Punica granatum]